MASRAVGALLAIVAAVALVVSLASSAWWSGHPNVGGRTIEAKHVRVGPLGATGCNTGGDGSCEPVQTGTPLQLAGYAATGVIGIATLVALALAISAWTIGDRRKGLARTMTTFALVAVAAGGAVIALGPDIQASQHVDVPIGWGTFVFGGGIVSSLVAAAITRKLEPEPLRLKPGIAIPPPPEAFAPPLAAMPPAPEPMPPAPAPMPFAPTPYPQPHAPTPEPFPAFGSNSALPRPVEPPRAAVDPFASTELRAGPPQPPLAPPPPRTRPVSAPPPLRSRSVSAPPPPRSKPTSMPPAFASAAPAAPRARPSVPPPPRLALARPAVPTPSRAATSPLAAPTRAPTMMGPGTDPHAPTLAARSSSSAIGDGEPRPSAPTMSHAVPPMPSPDNLPPPPVLPAREMTADVLDADEPGDEDTARGALDPRIAARAPRSATEARTGKQAVAADITSTGVDIAPASRASTETPTGVEVVPPRAPQPSLADELAARQSAELGAEAPVTDALDVPAPEEPLGDELAAASGMIGDSTDATRAPDLYPVEPRERTPIPTMHERAPAQVPMSTAPASLPPPRAVDVVPSGPTPACPQCEAPMAWVDEHLRFYCKQCRMYF